MSDIMDQLADWYEYHKTNEFEQSAEDIGKLMAKGSEEIGDLREENLNLRGQLAEARAEMKRMRARLVLAIDLLKSVEGSIEKLKA